MPNVRFINRGKTGEIWLYDQVGEGFFGGMSAKSFVSELQKLGKVDTINLHINSPGGSVFEGLTIYNALAQHPARIVVDVDGLAASIASVIAMAGDEVRIAENAMMMIHNPYTIALGDSSEMRKTADLLDQISGNIVATYAKQTKMPTADIQALMDDETWMTAGEAVDKGFATHVTAEQKAAACSDFDFSNFRRPPAHLTTAGASKRSAGHSMAGVKVIAMGSRVRQ